MKNKSKQKTVLWMMLLAPCLLASEGFADSWKGKNDYYGKKHGKWESHIGKTKKLEWVITYRHGIQNGLSQKFFKPSGKNNWSAVYKDGRMHGLYVEYYDNKGNSKKTEGNYVNGSHSGNWTHWHGNSVLSGVENYVNGKLHGPAEYSFSSGHKKFTTTYKDGNHHGPYVGYYDNTDNTKNLEGNHKDNQRSGNWTEWHDNGHKKSVANYYNGKQDGPAQYFYYHPGRKHIITNFKQGMHHGPYAEFFDNSANSRRIQGAHRDNKKDGLWTEWHGNSAEMSTEIYRQGQLHGSVKRFHSDGGADFETSYKNGKQDGPYIQYYHPAPLPVIPDLVHVLDMIRDKPLTKRKKVKKITGVHKNGKRVGEWIDWSSNGDKLDITPFRDGKEHGMRRMFRGSSLPGGSPKLHSELTYKNGKRHGDHIIYWNDNDNKHFHSTWVNGSQDGPSREWHENGKISVSGQYKKSKKDGVWKEFDDEGKLLKTYAYNMGNLVKGSTR